MQVDQQRLIDWALDVIKIEAKAIYNLTSCINKQFTDICQLILHCNGKVIVTGLGKSGHIARKIAATFASTGTPAFFLHPTEALHGDLGMLDKKDIVIALSNSGTTRELLDILPLIKRLGIPYVSLTGNINSSMAKLSDYHIHLAIEKEACSLGLAPTTSTSAALVIGDALAVTILQARGFTSEDFARSHPGGKLGKKLLIKIKDIMLTGKDIPKISENSLINTAILEITRKKLGMTIITSEKNPNKITGIFTDGDLRRMMDKNIDIHKETINKVMSKQFTSIQPDELAAKAVHLMEKHKFFMMPVIDSNNCLVGAFNMHQLLNAGVV